MLRLDHVVLPIWEVKKSLAFYREVLGLRLVEAYEGDDWDGFPWLMMIFALGDRREIVLVYLKGAKQPAASKLPKDVRHIALAETTAIERWKVKLDAAKVEYTEDNDGEQRSLYFEDPSGNSLEITAPPSTPALEESAEALALAQKWAKKRK
ncbi:MAG TPA: VOC family protein [Vitreimonas sp.]|jgi:catechol 2,3-dioxygenase-like lactoylglutathione lyase family enzyme|nr:VOC family protein [Vitreimonas sp.]